MKTDEIMVVYKWTAKAGKGEELKKIYEDVEKQMKETEPGALKVDCFFDGATGVLLVHDLFKDGDALGQHLGTTAAGHFPSLLQIAEPGPFLFCGNVPEPLKQAAMGMGLNATFASRAFGYDRGK
ncbi:putative quinol monooxygenase [Flagellimonas flava]|uniref:putative quinol monooxygenase n=1 Tax=Flagellimonas flava TaxID=570519 RepID=UPI003D645F20